MYFKRIEMHGFKSFAEPVVIEFHEGVTCIVGPNGSGKSNISDAIRWALGEQSPKMLRGGKMEEVIFSGTASRKSRGMAEVTLVIDNTAGILPIDYNEVAITRRMYRSGESEYLINNNQCRLRDIRELIMDTGIGVDGYSIIGQGKIAEIVSSKPESRREIFEEAAGVVLYKSKKTDAERKLTTTAANLERVNDIVGEIEGRIDGLREDSIKAGEYLELKEKYKALEINITLRNIEKLEEANNDLRADADQLGATIAELNIKKKYVDGALLESREKSDDLEQLGNEARDKLLLKVEEINGLTNKSQLNAERLSNIDKDSVRLEEEKTTLQEKLIRELENSKAIEEEMAEIATELAKADDSLQEKIQAYNEAVAVTMDLEGAMDDEKNKMFAIHGQISAKRSEAKSIESYKDSLTRRKEQLLAEGEDLEANEKAYAEALTEAETEKQAADERAAKLWNEMAQVGERAEACRKDERLLSQKREDIKLQKGQLSARKKTIEEMENNYEGYNSAVRFIMRSLKANSQVDVQSASQNTALQKDLGRGIHGVVADLMTVPKGYEVAIETALGAAMQNIVCNKDEDAKAAIRALKDSRAGRATFLPLSSIKGSKADVAGKLASAAGYIGLGADCISYDEKYKDIFSYLLGRVAIVDNMDNAVNLSKLGNQGLRFVTLEGEIINVSGAITGGKYKNATANLLERKQEIIKLEEQIKRLTKEEKEAEERLAELRQQAVTLQSDREKLDKEYQESKLASITLTTKLQTIAESQKETLSVSQKTERELASIEKEFAEADKMIASLLNEAKDGEQVIEEINEKINRDLASYEEAKAARDTASEAITTTRIAKKEWDSKAEGCQQLLARIRETAVDFQNQIDTKELQLADIEQEKNDILFGSEDAAELVKAKEQEKAELEEYISQVGKEKAELAKAMGEMSREQSQMGDTLNSYQDQKYQIEIKLTKNETQLDTFKTKLWEEFEITYLQAIDFRQEAFAMSTAVKESREIRNRMRELGDVNVGAIKEYEQVSQRYKFLTEQRADILMAMNELKIIIDDMETTIKEKFKQNFDQVVISFEEIFKKLFGGGHAELRLDNEDNPLEAGIEIIAQPPGKKLQNINLMSGGEKTMTAIALMFAVLKTKPTPFCILDEVEAALDDANIERFANYLREFHNIQFAIVTHQKATMEHADVLYGVTMPEQGISKVLSLRLGDDFEI